MDLLTAIRLLETAEGPILRRASQCIMQELRRISQRAVYQKMRREDICQEAFIAVWRNRHEIPHLPSLVAARSWLYTILRNREISSHRQERPLPDKSDASVTPYPVVFLSLSTTSPDSIENNGFVKLFELTDVHVQIEEEAQLRQSVYRAWRLFEELVEFATARKQARARAGFRESIAEMIALQHGDLQKADICLRRGAKDNTLDKRYSKHRRYLKEQFPAFIEYKIQEGEPVSNEQERWIYLFIQWLRYRRESSQAEVGDEKDGRLKSSTDSNGGELAD